MIEADWERIETWGSENAPRMLEDLNEGASADQISALEAELGLEVPDEFRRSLQVHDGESDGWPNKVFANRGAYLGTERILQEWQQRLEFGIGVLEDDEEQDREQQIRDGVISVVGPVKPDTFCKEWIPIMECNGDVFWALDLSPAEGGAPGQLIEVDWEACSWRVVANSFGEFLSSYASSLETGKYRIADGLPVEDGAAEL